MGGWEDDRGVNVAATRVISLALVVVVVTVWVRGDASARAAEPQAGKDWPQFLGPARDGVYRGDDVAPSWGKSGPPVIWQRDVGQGFSGPVVAGGRLVLFHRIGDREVLDCLDAKTGEPIWRSDGPASYDDDFGFDEGPRATPTVAERKVYTFGAQGMLTCRDLASGEPVWSVDTAETFGAPKGFFGMACSPLVEGDAVIVNVGGRDGAGIVAFDRNTGDVLWKATDDEASYSSPVAATVGGKRRVFVVTGNGLVTLDPAGGRIAARFPWRPPVRTSVTAATPLVVGDKVFLSASYGAGAVLLKIADGRLDPLWSGDESLSNHYATSVHHDGFLYGFHGRQEQGPSLRCVELASGKVRWEEEGFGAGSVLIAGDKLLALTEKGQLVCAPATPEGFKPTARAQVLPFECRAYPALSAGRLYARSPKKLACVDLRDP